MSNRKVKLTVREYFNQRLLDADGRFAKDIEYLLTAQYVVSACPWCSLSWVCRSSCWWCQYYATANSGKTASGTNAHSRCCQEPASDPADDTERWCLLLLKECQRFTSLLSEDHVRCARNDQTAWFANLVPHPVSSRHAVAGCRPCRQLPDITASP